MTKSLWMLLFLWVLITALTEMDPGQEKPGQTAGKLIIPPHQPVAQPGLAYNSNSPLPLKHRHTN